MTPCTRPAVVARAFASRIRRKLRHAREITMSANRSSALDPAHQRIARLRERLGAAQFDEELARGRALSLEETIDELMSHPVPQVALD